MFRFRKPLVSALVIAAILFAAARVVLMPPAMDHPDDRGSPGSDGASDRFARKARGPSLVERKLSTGAQGTFHEVPLSEFTREMPDAILLDAEESERITEPAGTPVSGP